MPNPPSLPPPPWDLKSHFSNPNRLLSRDEVDAIYGIPKRFLELAACKGDGPVFVKVGRLTRYRVADLEAWIEEHRFSSTSAADMGKDVD